MGLEADGEFKILKDSGFVRLLAIHASSNTRFDHIKLRDRFDSPSNHEKFLQRDKREIDVGISEVIARADEIISNNDLTIEELRNSVDKITMKWVSEYGNSESENIITR